MTIELNDVRLRRPEAEDIEELYAFRNDWTVVRSIEGFSIAYSRADLQDWIEFHRKQANEAVWVIAERETDRCIGHVGLYRIDHRVRSAEFGILIGNASWWGKGLGQRVSRAVLEFGFSQLNLHRVELSVLRSNEAAIHLYRNLGFVEEGVLRDAQFRDSQYVDVILMALLESERC